MTVGLKRKTGLQFWLWGGVILGAFVGLLALGGAACLPDKAAVNGGAVPEQVTSPLSDEYPASIPTSPQPSGQKQDDNVAQYVEPTNPMVRAAAVSAVQGAPEGIEANSEAWKIWQINYWVANNISYVSDPRRQDYPAYAHETLQIKGGDCDDFAILLASMYESVGLDAAIANIDTDQTGKADHMTCLVYYPEEEDSFIVEEKIILKKLGLGEGVRFSYFDQVDSKVVPKKYASGIWIVADPTMAAIKDMVGYISHSSYQATSVIDVE